MFLNESLEFTIGQCRHKNSFRFNFFYITALYSYWISLVLKVALSTVNLAGFMLMWN
jgi:hypothetical protein